MVQASAVKARPDASAVQINATGAHPVQASDMCVPQPINTSIIVPSASAKYFFI